MCAGKTLDQKIQGTFHFSSVVPSASVLGFKYELFFSLENTYQKFCSISLLSTCMGYLPDSFSHPSLVSNRKLVALELANPLKTRGRKQAISGCIQAWEQLFLSPPRRPKWVCNVKGDPQAGLQNGVCISWEFQLKCIGHPAPLNSLKPEGSRCMGSLGVLGTKLCCLLQQQAEASVVSFLSLCCLSFQREGPLCACAFCGLSDFHPTGMDRAGKHPPFTGRTLVYTFAGALAGPIRLSRVDSGCVHDLWVLILSGNDCRLLKWWGFFAVVTAKRVISMHS